MPSWKGGYYRRCRKWVELWSDVADYEDGAPAEMIVPNAGVKPGAADCRDMVEALQYGDYDAELHNRCNQNILNFGESCLTLG